METIEKFLKKYRTIDLAPAGDCEKIMFSKSQIDEIKSELKQIRKNNRSYFWIGVAMLIVLFILTVIIIITNLDNSETLTSVFTAFGCTTFGLISFMIYCWRQKCLTETLITLALYLQGDTLQTVIDILASQVKSNFKI